MLTKKVWVGSALTVLASLVFTLLVLATGQENVDKVDAKAQIQRGEYLVIAGGCHDCHSPKVFTPKGPEPDPARLLSGFPADAKLPEIPDGIIGPDNWGGLFTSDLTAWVGPWGVTFGANLTPDEQTGLGLWTEDLFIKTMRTGKHMGAGRDILPPMPWFNYAKLSEDDLKAMFAYLRTLKPVKNLVPAPIPPGSSQERSSKLNLDNALRDGGS
jgi:mono/diheme cytochrome c family protein